MQFIIKKTDILNGIIVPPSSKSQCIRGMLFSLLASGKSTLLNMLTADDTTDAMRVCESLGANITLHENQFSLRSNGLPLHVNTSRINTGNSGITTCFIMPILGLRKNTQERIILDCGEQMRARPIHSLVDALNQLGLSIQYIENNGSLPLSIQGQLIGGTAEVDGMTSQYISALLISLPCAPNDSQITVKNLHERPYMELTLDWLHAQGIQYSHEKFNHSDIFHLKGSQRYQPINTSIAGDFSSASYIIAAATLLHGQVTLSGLNMQDPQGDKRLVHLLQKMGADITINVNELIIRGGNELQGIQIDANDIPDLLPTLAVVGTQAKGKTEINNVPQARLKETDRIHSMTEGLKALGANITEQHDGITVTRSNLQGSIVKGYNDHRTVMALSIAGMLATGTTVINDGHAINKTYPHYLRDMKSLGANMDIQHDK